MTEKITIIGSGLVGSLLGVFLSKRGLKADLLEWRADLRKQRIAGGRSINLAISTRGLSALARVGLKEKALALAIPMQGRMVHPKEGQPRFQRYGQKGQCIHSISRDSLTQLLMDEAERLGQVQITFKKRCANVDLLARRIEVRDEETGKTQWCPFDRLVGADGSGSVLRGAIVPAAQRTEEVLEYGYKELTLPPKTGGDPFILEKNALHIWPRGAYMLIALPNLDGSFTCTLFLPHQGEVSFERLNDAETIARFFAKEFPDVAPLFPSLVENFQANPTGHMVTIKCQPWNADGHAALIGDAAHAIVPFFGQGMNCGFEDVVHLDGLLSQHLPHTDVEWAEVFKNLFKTRKLHTDAIADMAIENFVEMRDRVADPAFVIQKQAEAVLQEAFPGKYISRYSLVSFTTTPYRWAYEAGLIQKEILEELCKNLKDGRQIELDRANQLIHEKLVPFYQKYPIGEL